ncbi:hypothetical protein PR202_ga16055 [Eleusine coracana subsp. coracana]|uniref:Holocarboxylase synthetase n=1 Tax=Eleusine coracana subsp. coracana TaxID=191504 RepID=A0AAV5CLL1_ELECO|nr:hypothetical protein PR202_ga16055 [Eleusine coracana subsp. coracana]
MAGKKRKAEAARLEETDRALYGAFRGAANSLSQLYTLAMGAQKASFQAGERHAMEKLYEWILRQHENGLRLTVADIASHIQSKNSMVFSNALSSPIRRSLQPYHLEQGGDTGYFANSGNRDMNPTASNDSFMDMHSDSPAHDSF